MGSEGCGGWGGSPSSSLVGPLLAARVPVATTVTGAFTYTVANHLNRIVPVNSATEVVMTLPTAATAGDGCTVLQVGVGSVEVCAGGRRRSDQCPRPCKFRRGRGFRHVSLCGRRVVCCGKYSLMQLAIGLSSGMLRGVAGTGGVTLPTPIHDLDITNATMDTVNIVSIPNLGTSGVEWIPFSGANSGAAALMTRTAVGSKFAANLSASRRIRLAGNFPAGDYSVVVPVKITTFGNGVLLAWGQVSANGDIYLTGSSSGISVRNNTQGGTSVVAVDALDAALNLWSFIVVTYDRTLNQAKIYLNGALLATGTPALRNASPSNSGGTDWNGYNNMPATA